MTDTSGTTKNPKAGSPSPKTGSPSPKTGSPSPKTGAAEVPVEDEDKKEKPVKEIPVIHDTGFFQHDTGDTYDGEFEAKKKELSVKMHGHGVYTTAEGDTYTARWENNIIDSKETAIVSYNDGAKFEGFLKDFSYQGTGKYTYPDGSILTGEFSDNCPVGQLVLTDPNGHIWLAKAEQGFAWCSPVNHFYEMLETTTVRTKRRHKSLPLPEESPTLVTTAARARKATTAIK